MFRQTLSHQLHKVFNRNQTPSIGTTTKEFFTASRSKQFLLLRSQHCGAKADLVVQLKFPLVWLRDNCLCSECFHSESQSRIIDWTRFDVEVQPETIEFNNSTATLHIRWSDHHSTAHSLGWLRERDFSTASRLAYVHSGYRPARQPWTARTFTTLISANRFAYSAILRSDRTLHAWLHQLAVHGCAFISDAPSADPSVCRRLATRIAHIRPTHYGLEYHVRHTVGTQNTAYLAAPLQLHTDLPYYEHAPGVNMLHCAEQSHAPDGAHSQLVDGLAVAERMRREWPGHFERLTRTEVDWLDVGADGGRRFHKRLRAPVIGLRGDGSVGVIRQSVPQRDSRFACAAEEVYGWYRAHAKWVELLYEAAVRFKMSEGDVLVFDNARLVHGRTGYADVAGNVRHLVGAFVDWDEIYSRLRVLEADGVGDLEQWISE